MERLLKLTLVRSRELLFVRMYVHASVFKIAPAADVKHKEENQKQLLTT